MQNIKSFVVAPKVPDRLKPLLNLAHNMWWTWNRQARELFTLMDPDLLSKGDHNPLYMIGNMSQERLEQLASDESFLLELDRITAQYNEYIQSATWFKKAHSQTTDKMQVAYFTAEFGIHECLPIYSGGLALLAGDH